jgi:hypothetical protein
MAGNAWRVMSVAAVFALVIYVSHNHGLPTQLPGAALGWPLLFHMERAAALLGTLGIVLLVGWRALRAEFPIKFGNVEYAVKEAAARADEASEAHERRIQFLEAYAEIGPPPQPSQGYTSSYGER